MADFYFETKQLAVGYDGMINLGETILEILAHKKFHDDIRTHVKLPYKKWWLDQKDAYILARQPELAAFDEEAWQAEQEEREEAAHA